jgi:NDP-4-keto-2,6-dideoxyhexose 3-C-methyltransferase
MRIKACRICGNKKLIKIGSLGNIAISDFTDTPQEGKKYSLELVYCEKCTLLQLAHNTPRDLLYKNYWYESHINPVIVNDLKEIAQYGKGIHYDIGANDGTLLEYSKADLKLGIDPSNITTKNWKDGKIDLWTVTYWENYITDIKADVITAIACLYDLPDPNKFVANITRHLKHNGIFISQLQTLSPMIELNDVGNICHEHLEYYSYKSLVWLFEKNGLEIYKVEENKINGGSYRIFARHFKKGSIQYPEKEYGVKELKDFMKRIEQNKLDYLLFTHAIDHRKEHDGVLKTVYGYGASTKANTILQYYGAYLPKAIIDINPNKKDKYTIETKIPIINKIPDDCEYLWVFPYSFIDYFKEKEKGYKGKWITTIPEFKVWG